MMVHIEEAIQDIKKGKMVVVLDDTLRENEGDLIMAARFATPRTVNFMLREARGLLCVPMERERAKSLNLWPIVPDELNTEYTRCKFMVSVDYKISLKERSLQSSQFKTGVSASARAATIRALSKEGARARDFTRPGHITPLVAEDFGVLTRDGHTEATVDLCRLAGITPPVGMLMEILKKDGSIARSRELMRFTRLHKLTLVCIKDIIAYRKYHEKLVDHVASAKLPTRYGNFIIHAFQEVISGKVHLALVMGSISKHNPTLVRVHSRCLTGDALSSLRCDCQSQLIRALQEISARGNGVLVYLNQEGRGIGLMEKIKSYHLQDQGYDTVEANVLLGHRPDMREYHIGSQILRNLGVEAVELMTNNPAKIEGVEQYGLKIVKRIPLVVPPTDYNRKYMSTKRDKMGHLLH